MKQEFLKAVADTIRITIYQDNRPVVPSSATITLLSPSGGTLQASVAVTAIDSTTGEMTYSLTSTHTATLGTNYKATWAYVVSGVTYYEEQLFDIVLSKLSIPIVDEDLYNELDSLRNENYQESGTAASATSSTLVDTANRKEPDDYWTGGVIEIVSGTGDGQVRDITDFVQSTSTITVSPNWATTPSTDSVYRIVRGYTKKILQSFDKISQMIYDKGNRPALIMESSQIKIPMLYLTIHFICLDLMKEADDKWDRLAVRYWDLFQDAFGKMKLEYDADESGTISGDEEQEGVNSVRLFRT